MRIVALIHIVCMLVTGLAGGASDEAEAHYAEARAWLEVYFPGYGWIEYEPTAGLLAIRRPEDSLLAAPAEPERPPEPITALRTRVRWAWWLGIGGGSLILVFLGLLTGCWWTPGICSLYLLQRRPWISSSVCAATGGGSASIRQPGIRPGNSRWPRGSAWRA